MNLPAKPSYAQVMQAAFGQTVGAIAGIIIVVTNLGACTVYLVFVGQLLQTAFGVTPYISIIASAGVLAVASWVKSLRNIAYFSLLGDLSLVVAMTVVLVYAFNFFEIQPLSAYPGFTLSTWSQCYSSVLFLMGELLVRRRINRLNLACN
jgi:amino acid permease